MDREMGAAAAERRRRLLVGLAAAVQDKGLSATTIADIVAHAGVSKRTFYEEFRAKDDAFLALYDVATDRVIEAIRRAVAESDSTLEAAVRAATAAYFRALAAEPSLSRAHLLDIYSLGDKGLAARRAVLQRYAKNLRVIFVERSVAGGPPIAPSQLTAFVGGLNELALEALEEGRGRDLAGVADDAATFALRVFAAQ